MQVIFLLKLHLSLDLDLCWKSKPGVSNLKRDEVKCGRYKIVSLVIVWEEGQTAQEAAATCASTLQVSWGCSAKPLKHLKEGRAIFTHGGF